jgi:hypothetical protein
MYIFSERAAVLAALEAEWDSNSDSDVDVGVEEHTPETTQIELSTVAESESDHFVSQSEISLDRSTSRVSRQARYTSSHTMIIWKNVVFTCVLFSSFVPEISEDKARLARMFRKSNVGGTDLESEEKTTVAPESQTNNTEPGVPVAVSGPLSMLLRRDTSMVPTSGPLGLLQQSMTVDSEAENRVAPSTRLNSMMLARMGTTHKSVDRHSHSDIIKPQAPAQLTLKVHRQRTQTSISDKDKHIEDKPVEPIAPESVDLLSSNRSQLSTASNSDSDKAYAFRSPRFAADDSDRDSDFTPSDNKSLMDGFAQTLASVETEESRETDSQPNNALQSVAVHTSSTEAENKAAEDSKPVNGTAQKFSRFLKR